ncbi:MAG: hypothetical protein J6D15_05220 [Clostridia bacterium]|nr:hypothetical protein [Clostridia bacterium]
MIKYSEELYSTDSKQFIFESPETGNLKSDDLDDLIKSLSWDAYQEVKHNRDNAFSLATYRNAVMALSALYILVFYISKTTNISFPNYKSEYIDSEYSDPYFLCSPEKSIP